MDFANAFPWKSEMIFNFCKWIFNFRKWISKILEMDFQFLEMDFKFLEIDFRFGDVFQCISLNLSNEFLIKKLYNLNNFYIFVKKLMAFIWILY
jgi:hypothetical protein